MGNIPKEPDLELQEYIRSKYRYDDGRIEGPYKYDIGHIHYRGKNRKPYMRIDIQFCGEHYKFYRCHIVYFLCSGSWPHMEIDHIDRNSLNDKYENLVSATRMENQRNKDNYRYGFEIDRTSSGKYRARSKLHNIYLGVYMTKEIAYEAINKYLEGKGLMKDGKSVG